MLPPHAKEALQRFEQNPKLYDRVDQFCQNKTIDTACTIPGSAFEGGGDGVCKRNLPNFSQEIDLRCTLESTLEIDRRIPDGPFRKGQHQCNDRPENPSEYGEMSCIDPPPVADRFCAGHKINDQCTAVFNIAGNDKSEVGRCRITIEERKNYEYGHQLATRRVLQCLPIRPAPASIIKALPLSKKLLLW